MEYYWLLKYGDYKDLKQVRIPPASVQVVKKRWDNGDPIHLSTGSIPANQIREFEISDIPFSDRPLLEEVARAFKEPMTTTVDDGRGNVEEVIQARWVKKTVTQSKWEKFYSASPGYKLLSEMSGMVIIAFRQPVHQIDTMATPYCSEDEIRRLTNSNQNNTI